VSTICRKLFKQHAAIFAAVLALVLVALPVAAQAGPPSIVANDQLSLDGNVVIESVVSDGPGFIVIHADSGEGTPGPVIGVLPVVDGESRDRSLRIDTSAATPTLFAMLHVDDNEIGEYEFGSVEGADGPAVVDGAVVVVPFNVVVLTAPDQFVADNTVTISSVTTAEAGWVVIHASQDEGPGPVIGYAPVEAGTSTGITVELTGEATDVLWPMLHVDTGAAGEYEFGTVDGADGPVSINADVAVLPIWTVPHVRAFNQPLRAGSVLGFNQVLIDAPGWLVIHADTGGGPAEVIGVSEPLVAGLNRNVVVEVDPSAASSTVWAMLHYDTGVAGEYEFGTVEGADGPVMFNGAVVMSALQVGMPEPEPMMEMEATTVDVSLVEWAIEMPASLPAGTVTFNVTNNGTMGHNFSVEGDGVSHVFDANLVPGETASVTLDLAAGTYVVICPLPGHADQGMRVELTVEG